MQFLSFTLDAYSVPAIFNVHPDIELSDDIWDEWRNIPSTMSDVYDRHASHFDEAAINAIMVHWVTFGAYLEQQVSATVGMREEALTIGVDDWLSVELKPVSLYMPEATWHVLLEFDNTDKQNERLLGLLIGLLRGAMHPASGLTIDKAFQTSIGTLTAKLLLEESGNNEYAVIINDLEADGRKSLPR